MSRRLDRQPIDHASHNQRVRRYLGNGRPVSDRQRVSESNGPDYVRRYLQGMDSDGRVMLVGAISRYYTPDGKPIPQYFDESQKLRRPFWLR